MLGKTAGGLYWMFRYLERAEYMARLVDAGFHIALTRAQATDADWESVLQTAGVADGYAARHGEVRRQNVIDYFLVDRENSSSVICTLHSARSNARLVRTALTRETWEATNEAWLTLSDILSRPILEAELPETLAAIRRQNALVRGALHGTMLRNDAYRFATLGTFVERADNTARILDVKYYVLLPSAARVGSDVDNVQWESVLRSVSGQRAFRWLHGAEISAGQIANFLIFDRRMPRSLSFCAGEVVQSLEFLDRDYERETDAKRAAQSLHRSMKKTAIDDVFQTGLHEFLGDFRTSIAGLSGEIERDFRFQA